MVKNKIVRFVVPIITCCLVVVACVVPAKATDTSTDNIVTGEQAVASTFAVLHSVSKASNTSHYIVHPFAQFADPDIVQVNKVFMEAGYGVGDSFLESLRCHTSVTNYVDATYGTFKRVSNQLQLWTDINNDGNPEYYFREARIYSDRWSYPSFNDKFKVILSTGYVVTGSGIFDVAIGIRYVTNTGESKLVEYTRAGVTVGGYNSATSTPLYDRRACLTRTDCNAILSLMTDYNGGYIQVDYLNILYEPYDQDKEPQLGFDIIGDDVTLLDPFPSQQYDSDRYYNNNGIKYTDAYYPSITPDLSEGEQTFKTFFANVVGGFFDVPLLGEVTLGNVLSVILGVLVIIWVFKVFAGG